MSSVKIPLESCEVITAVGSSKALTPLSSTSLKSPDLASSGKAPGSIGLVQNSQAKPKARRFQLHLAPDACSSDMLLLSGLLFAQTAVCPHLSLGVSPFPASGLRLLSKSFEHSPGR